MSKSFYKIWIHAIWSTKNRLPIIHPQIGQKIWKVLAEQLQDQGCRVGIVNGMPDHVHCLFLMNPNKSVAEVIKQIKGSSSYYVNHHDLIPEKFSWQNGFSAFSVSESGIKKVYEYIKGQQAHHQKKTFLEEYEQFIKLYGFVP